LGEEYLFHIGEERFKVLPSANLKGSEIGVRDGMPGDIHVSQIPSVFFIPKGMKIFLQYWAKSSPDMTSTR
jgi:hypothetical protein